MATLDRRGRITIAAEVQQALRLHIGDRVEVVPMPTGRAELTVLVGSVRSLKGMFGDHRDSVSIEDMNTAVASQGALRS